MIRIIGDYYMSFVKVILNGSIYLDYLKERMFIEKHMKSGMKKSTKNMIKRRITWYLLLRGMYENKMDGL